MDSHTVNEASCHCSSDNVEINIDHLIAAMARLNGKILQLRREIVAFKEETKTRLSTIHNSKPASSGFNDSTKSTKERADASGYELRRNFKGTDSPSGTDLSVRLSFAKRAREVKAANAAVFKEDYPRDDKSIENDERPDRSSRVFEPSRTYRKFIPDAKNYAKEINERDIRISHITDENFKKPNKYKTEVISDNTYDDCSSRNVITSKIKRKRISRGVQYDASTGHQTQTGLRFLDRIIRSRSNGKKSDLAQKIRKKRTVEGNTFEAASKNEANTSLVKEVPDSDIKLEKYSIILSNKKITKLLNDTNVKIETSENKAKAIERNIDTTDNKKQEGNDESLKNHEIKENRLKHFFTIFRISRKNNAKMQQDASQCIPDNNYSHKKKETESNSENKKKESSETTPKTVSL